MSLRAMKEWVLETQHQQKNLTYLVHLDESGFTIVEIIVSIVVSALFMISFSVMVGSLNVLNDRGRDLTLTNSFIENKVEALRSQGFIAMPVSGTTVTFTDDMPSTLAEPRSAQYTITDVNASLKKIDLVVSYYDYGPTRQIEYTTYIGELGVGQY